MNENESFNTDHFICPISLEFMKDPVMCSDGNTYERSAISQWFRNHKTSPINNEVLKNFTLTPNLALKAGINCYLNDLEEKNRKRKAEELQKAVASTAALLAAVPATEPVQAVRKMPARKTKKVRV